mmetsp:Transcript_20209/g.65102  ORF Transcript_20209/g.65102 Transcript_20209/m.65102 type:complete len:423 (-) Transcript_20209:110-1378(-)
MTDDPPRLEAWVVGWRRRCEVEREFVLYEISVQFGTLAWRIDRRYRDFRALHSAIGVELGLRPLPRATTRASVAYGVAKMLGRRNAAARADAVAGSRTKELSTYLSEACAAYAKAAKKLSPLAEAAILEFFGTANQATLRVVHARRLQTVAASGDLLLFRSRDRASTAQRCVTGSRYDHVAIVVEGSSSETSPMKLLLEATCDGVERLPIEARVRAYGASEVALRRLRPPRDEDPLSARSRAARLAAFADAVDGAAYAFGFQTLLGGIAAGFFRRTRTTIQGDLDGPPRTTPTCRPFASCASPKIQDETFFCSQLTARALQIAGVLRDDVLPDAFWPGTFATENAATLNGLLLVEGFSYDDEIPIDTRVLGVAQCARRRRTDGRSRSDGGLLRGDEEKPDAAVLLTPRASNHLKRHVRRREA